MLRENHEKMAPAPGPIEFGIEGGGGGRVFRSQENEMPTDLKEHLLELEAWAITNKKAAKKDTIAF